MKKFIYDLGLNPDNFTFYKLIVGTVVFLMPLANIAIGIVSLILFDLCLGVTAAYKNKIPITSRRASSTIYKLLVYIQLLIVGLIADNLLKLDLFVQVITYFLVIVEVYSISENFQRITGLSFVNYLKKQIENKMKGAFNTKELLNDIKKRKN